MGSVSDLLRDILLKAFEEGSSKGLAFLEDSNHFEYKTGIKNAPMGAFCSEIAGKAFESEYLSSKSRYWTSSK
jgi:hypothetical protein